MGKQVEMIGKRFGRLVAIKQTGKDHKGFRYLFACDCGKEIESRGALIRSGRTRSCGCLKSEMTTAKNFVHGKSKTSEYRSMQARNSHMQRKKRMPKWANKEAIKQFYLNKPKGYQVDHVIPLRGKNVSGLHVEENLQYLLPEQNRKKSNHYSLAR
jgi:5-methylcytosine-specific restriction endonuclease McrA